MADTAVLNTELVRLEDRKEEGLPPKSFTDAVQQGEPVDETTDAKSGNSSENVKGMSGTGVGLKEEKIAQDKQIRTDGITNGNMNGKENAQKMELEGRSEATTPDTNGSEEKKDFVGAVRN